MRMSGKMVIFVASDYSLQPSLDKIGAELTQRGHQVIAGPPQRPPVTTEFAPASLERYFGATDLVVTATRTALTRETLEAAPRLRGVVFLTTGTESIDMQAADELGIPVAHGPFPENFNAMAEATVMLMLALMYDMKGSERVLRDNLDRPKAVRARLLHGKTIGLIGLGRIARGVAQRLEGWGVRVIASVARKPSGDIPGNVGIVGLDQLLGEADIVSLHASLTAETHHLLGARQFALMKPSAYLVNTARGGLIDEEALCEALQARRIAGAALDAFEREPLPQDSMLRQLDNLILTPHMVGHTQDGLDAVPRTALENIERLMRGEPPLYCKNPHTLSRWPARLSAIAGTDSAPQT